MAALAEQAAAQVTAGPDNADASFGPLNNASQLERVSGFISRLPDHARLVAGGSRVGDRGYFFEASVVDGLEQTDFFDGGRQRSQLGLWHVTQLTQA